MKSTQNNILFFRLLYLFLSIIFSSLLLAGLIKCSDNVDEEPLKQITQPRINAFGFCSDSLDEQAYTVQKNETFSNIFLSFGVAENRLPTIFERASGVFDVRKIIAGDNYYTFTKPDSLSSLVYFVYERSPINFVVFDLNDSVNVYETSKLVTIKESRKSAVIDQSLYVSLMQSEATPELAIKLSQIFAWQIDFYQLQEGDNFKVIYEEKYVDDNFIGLGKIKAAYFNHNGKDYYAIPFVQDSVFQYFDDEGNSLKKAFLKSPLEFGRITSRFSKSRLHPILKTRRPHFGVDYAAPVGTPVRSTGDGVVLNSGYQSGSGKFIKIRHNSVYSTMYMHLSHFAKGIKKGSRVKQGEVIGYVGSTGLSTGPHLDYRFFVNEKPVNPLTIELPPSLPVRAELKNQYEAEKDSAIKLLNQIEFNSKKPV